MRLERVEVSGVWRRRIRALAGFGDGWIGHRQCGPATCARVFSAIVYPGNAVRWHGCAHFHVWLRSKPEPKDRSGDSDRPKGGRCGAGSRCKPSECALYEVVRIESSPDWF